MFRWNINPAQLELHSSLFCRWVPEKSIILLMERDGAKTVQQINPQLKVNSTQRRVFSKFIA